MNPYKAIFLDWDDTIGDWTNAEKVVTATYIVPKLMEVMKIL